jgi:hypothetical protein
MQDDPKIAERRHGRQVKQAVEDAVGLTIAERLTRAAKNDRISIPMTDEDGDFVLEMREPFISERKTIQKMLNGIKDNTIKQQEQAEEDLANLLAKYSIDPSLDVDFWVRADFTPSKFQSILLHLLGLSEDNVRQAKEIIEAQSFRKN